MKTFYAEDAADLVHQLNDLGKPLIDTLPLFDAIEVGGESFKHPTDWSWGLTLITKVDDDGLMEEDDFQTLNAYSMNKYLVVGISNNTGNIYSYIHGYDGKVFDAFFYDGLIETLKKSFLLSTLHGQFVSYNHCNFLEILGRMGDEDAAEMAKYSHNHL